MALTAHSTIGEWLEDPTGGELVRGLLAQSGADPESLTPVLGLPLQQLVTLSQGQMPQSVVDDLVRAANGGEIPEATEATGWVEQITPGRFTGKTVIVTGAASGLGKATASRIAREGGRVIASDIAADKLDALKSELPDIITVAGDLTRQDAIDSVLAAAGDRIDGLANVAGINDDFSPAGETTDAVWDRVIAINLTAPFKLMRAVPPADGEGRPRVDPQRLERSGPARQRVGQRLHGEQARHHRRHEVRGVHVRAEGHPCELRRSGRRGHRHPDAASDVRGGVCATGAVPAGDPDRRDRRAPRRLHHIPAER